MTLQSHVLVCATVMARTLDELRAARERVEMSADLVELRLDDLDTIDVQGALHGRKRPVILTCRPRWEGGRFNGSEEERKRILAQAIASDADYVDIEWRADFGDLVLARGGRGVVLSMHQFDGVACDLRSRLSAMSAMGAEILKVAVRVERLADTRRLLDLQHQIPGQKLAVIGMGQKGIATRILACRFGSVWTYAGGEAHVGQIDLDTLLDVYRFRRITRDTAVYGIAGEPLAHSLSPAMHNAAFAAAERDAVYVPFETDSAEELLAAADAFNVAGLSITAPLKISLLDYVRRRDAWVESVSALNTLKRGPHGWEATNTDVPGFLEPLRGEALHGIRATVIGSGGAARAAVAALRSQGASVTVSARRRRMAGILAGPGGHVTQFPPDAGTWDLLVNTTPLGTWPRVTDTPVPAPLLAGGRLVYDLVYNPPVTKLLREAAAAGCRTIGGVEMLIAQAERQFEWWTGQLPAPGLFREVAHASHVV
jgi:3-dehydroquinate dehydratase/shikimate dehydrogenase